MYLGFDIGGTKTAFAVFDQTFSRLESHQFDTPTSNYDEFLDLIGTTALDKTRSIGAECQGIGIGLPGIIDGMGTSFSANVPCISGHDVQGDLGQAIGRQVHVINDVHAFTLSEATGGAGGGFETTAGVVLGTGLAGGLVSHGKLNTGANGVAGEWGHIPIAATAINKFKLPLFDCPCGGVACAETYMSGPGLTRIAAHVLNEQVTPAVCIERYRNGDQDAATVFGIWIDCVASCFGQIILHHDPDVIVIGGGLSNIDELYQAVPGATQSYLFKGVNVPPIRRAKFGADSGVRGAAIRASQ